MYSPLEPQTTQEPISAEARRMLESYLRQACSAEEAVVSAEDQEDLRTEMTGHILALAAAHQELGASPEEAMQAALRQFGQAEQIGQAVGREIGKRPSFLGSPHTISMIGGFLANWFTLTGVNVFLDSTPLHAMSPEAMLFGMAIGIFSGSRIWKRRVSSWQAARWNARFCVGTTAFSIGAVVLSSFICAHGAARHYLVESVRMAIPIFLQWIAVAGISGACSGALTGLWCQFIHRHLGGVVQDASPSR